MLTNCHVTARPQVHQLRGVVRLGDDEGAEAVAHVASISHLAMVTREGGAPLVTANEAVVVAQGVVVVVCPEGAIVFDDVDARAVAGAADAAMERARVFGRHRWLQAVDKVLLRCAGQHDGFGNVSGEVMCVHLKSTMPSIVMFVLNKYAL